MNRHFSNHEKLVAVFRDFIILVRACLTPYLMMPYLNCLVLLCRDCIELSILFVAYKTSRSLCVLNFLFFCDVLLVAGDGAWLDPACVGQHRCSTTTLTEVMRQTKASCMPRVAAGIRVGDWPALAPYLGPAASWVTFVPCSEGEILEASLRIYKEVGGTGCDHSVRNAK